MTGKRFRYRNELIIFAFFLALYVLIFRGEYYSMDEMARYGLTKTIVLEHDLSITKADGTSFSIPYPLLQSVAAVPLYMLGELLAGGIDPILREETGRLFVSLFNSIVTALSCVVFFRLCRRLDGGARSSLLLTLVFGLSTITLPYARVFLSEPLTGLLLMFAALLALSSSRERPLGGIFAGLFLALAAANNYIALPAMGIFFMFFVFQSGGPKEVLRAETLKDARLWGLILFGMAAVAEGLWYNHVRFGSYFSSAYHYYEAPPNTVYPEGMGLLSYPILAGIYGFLLSPMRSVFLYSPPLIGALFGWRRFITERGKTAVFLLSIPLLYLLVYSKWFGWHGGYAWGPRYMVSVTGFFLIPFIYLIRDYSRLRPATRLSVLAMCIGGFVIQLLPTILHPVASFVKVLEDYGGLPNELLIMHLPQACSVVVQTRLLKTIAGPADTDLYFLKHLDSGAHLAAMCLIAGLLTVTAILYLAAIRRAAHGDDGDESAN